MPTTNYYGQINPKTGMVVPYTEEGSKLRDIIKEAPEPQEFQEPTKEEITPQPRETASAAQDLAAAGREIKEAEKKAPDTTAVKTKTAGQDEVAELLKADRERIQTVLEKAEQRGEDVSKLIEDFERVSPTQISRQMLEQYGASEMFSKLQESVASARGVRQELITLEQQRDARIEAEKQRTVSQATIDRSVAKVKENYNRQIADVSARLSAESAYQESLKGNISLARSMAQEAVQYAIWEDKAEYQQLQDTYKMSRDVIEDLGKEYDRAFQLALTQAQKKAEKSEQEKSFNMELQMDATKYGVKLDLLGKSNEEAVEEYNRVVAPVAAQQLKTTTEIDAGTVALANQVLNTANAFAEDPDISMIQAINKAMEEVDVPSGQRGDVLNYVNIGIKEASAATPTETVEDVAKEVEEEKLPEPKLVFNPLTGSLEQMEKTTGAPITVRKGGKTLSYDEYTHIWGQGF